MKKIILSSVLILVSFTVLKAENSLEIKTTNFLMKTVSNGLVNYDLIASDNTEIKGLSEEYAKQENFEKLNESERKAFLINAYNINVIKLITVNHGIKSPLDVNGFFDAKKITVAGNNWTLDQLENKEIRPKYNDARVHFALVCGAKGCPRISSSAYTGSNLEDELDNAAKNAINSGWFVYEKDGKLMVSEIFKWFEDDFGGSKNIISYINLFSNKSFDKDLKVDYYGYDWNLNNVNSGGASTKASMKEPEESEFNLQTFTGGSLLKKGQIDITSFNTIYTQTKVNWMGQQFNDSRETFITHLVQGTFGVSNSGRFNVGFDLNFKASARRSDLSAASTFDAYSFQNNDSTRVGLTSVGLRLKYSPFPQTPNFSIQSTFFVPTVSTPEGFTDSTNPTNSRYFLDWDRYIWWNQFFYDKTFGDFQIFTSGELLFRFKKNEGQTSAVDIPVKAFLSYFPNNKTTVYVYSEHVPRFRYDTSLTTNDAITTPANYTASGAGLKYQFSPNFNVELLYSNFWRTTNAGLGNTFNVGLKYLIL